MFGLFGEKTPSLLDAPITRVLVEMSEYGPGTPEYDRLLQQLSTLYELKAKERRHLISPDVALETAGRLLGVLIIVNFERTHVWVTKAMSVFKPN